MYFATNYVLYYIETPSTLISFIVISISFCHFRGVVGGGGPSSGWPLNMQLSLILCTFLLLKINYEDNLKKTYISDSALLV